MIAIVNKAVTIFEGINGNEILIVIGLIRGIILGITQYFVLRRYILNFFSWLIATTIGAFIGWIFMLVVSVITALEFALTTEVLPTSLLFVRLLWLGATMGTVMGLAQGLAIKKCLRLGIKEVVLLINSNAFAYAVSLFLGLKSIVKVSFFHLAIAGATMGVINGIITGLVLIHLVNIFLKRYNFYRNGW
ncbi:hypothetical protein H6G35_36320 [Aulosira sp. FACHB-113]|uniref:hypothetical protein n=1 Tax=Tolypothrix tenuis TaxID=457083 RepID=UPI0019CD54D5|nr:hypothetical protein [Aulosira sp. FACHB-113]